MKALVGSCRSYCQNFAESAFTALIHTVQAFDLLVDREGHYVLVGHTTVGEGVVNWDYLAIRWGCST